jgi:hypothetical protein
MERNLRDRFRRERPRILSSLRQCHLQTVFPWDPDVLDQIYQRCWQECTAVVTQLLASGTSTTLSQHHANTLLTQPFDEAGPSSSYSPVQPGPTTLPQSNGMDLDQLQGQHQFTSQGCLSFCQPSGNIEQDRSYSNMGSTDLDSMDYYLPLEQPDAGYAGAMLDFGFPPSTRLC